MRCVRACVRVCACTHASMRMSFIFLCLPQPYNMSRDYPTFSFLITAPLYHPPSPASPDVLLHQLAEALTDIFCCNPSRPLPLFFFFLFKYLFIELCLFFPSPLILEFLSFSFLLNYSLLTRFHSRLRGSHSERSLSKDLIQRNLVVPARWHAAPGFDEWFTSCLPAHNRRSLNQFLKQNTHAEVEALVPEAPGTQIASDAFKAGRKIQRLCLHTKPDWFSSSAADPSSPSPSDSSADSSSSGSSSHSFDSSFDSSDLCVVQS